jgi:hypothetical protein
MGLLAAAHRAEDYCRFMQRSTDSRPDVRKAFYWGGSSAIRLCGEMYRHAFAPSVCSVMSVVTSDRGMPDINPHGAAPWVFRDQERVYDACEKE